MKVGLVKITFCAVLALPVVVLRCLLACVDYCLASCDMKLRYGVWPEPVNKPKTPGQDKGCDIDRTMQFVSMGTDRKINDFRRSIEAGPIGRRVVMCHHDRHLYAVLKPTRAENLQRIRNVLSALSSETIRKCRESTEAKK